ncbi:MAG: outer membrane beta-barrel protein [Alphaproteobacteria bacterium]|jgi:opacity protein-like surface antigen|nr:outer membrane beta-barrel protein [Alphaproteobacteria bacterium]MDP6563833.1 outer membrane beta-barrel protein [Alphaproteobacteria bacterium]MDP6811730.1 outer membrane beta-barrel protein [Alphaproteobacteria bacterium]
MRAWILPSCLGLAVLFAAPAMAGTKGGLYDMRALLNQGHPFAGPSAVVLPTAAPPIAVAPPAPTLRYTPPPPPPPPAAKAMPAPTIRPAPTVMPVPLPRTAQKRPAPRPLPMPAPDDDSNDGFFSFLSFDDDPADDWLDRFYLVGGGGLDWAEDVGGNTVGGGAYSIDMDSGFALQAAIGSYFGGNIRGEAELAHRTADYDQATSGGATATGGGELTLTTVMANLYYDFRLGSAFVPYIGAGLGLAFIDGDDRTIGGAVAKGRDGTEFAYQAIVGVWYEFDRTWAVGADGRYLGTGDDDAGSTSLMLNARYNL